MSSNGDALELEPAPAKASLWEDFVDIFYAPSSVFARRANGEWGKPLLFLVITGTVLFFVTKNAMQPIMDAEFARQSAAAMRRNPNITAEQLASGRNFFETLGPVFFALVHPEMTSIRVTPTRATRASRRKGPCSSLR